MAGIIDSLQSVERDEDSRSYGEKLEPVYFLFDGVYLSDLERVGFGARLFAYCVLPLFDKRA